MFTGIERAKFRRPVTPGDQLRIEVEVLSFRTRAGRIEGRAYVDGKLACQATLTCAVVPREREQRAHDGAQRRRASRRGSGDGVSIHPSAVIAAGSGGSGIVHGGPVLHHRP